MRFFSALTMLLLTTSLLMAQTPTDLFFSEYIEGSGNNKALEIYNPTNQAIDLSVYYVLRFSNGSSTFAEGGATRLTGTIAPYSTFVLVNGQTTSTPTSPACSPVLQAMANQLDGVYPAPTYMNGNDAIALVKTPGGVPPNADMSNVTSVDLIGQIGLGSAISSETGWSYVQDSTLTYNNSNGDPVTGKVVNYIVKSKATDGTTFGPFWMSWTSDHSLIRKPNIIKGVVINPSPFVVKLEWDTVPAITDTAGHQVYKDIWTELGRHVCVADPTHGLGETPAANWMQIYPNPVVGDNFTVATQFPVITIEVYSLIGQVVYKQAFNSGQKVITLGTTGLMKGIYMVKVTSTNNVTIARKIVIN